MKLSTKLTFLYVGAILSLVVLSVLFFQHYVLQRIEEQIRSHLQERANQTMDKIDRFLFERTADVQLIASDALFHNPQYDLEELTKRLIAYRNAYKVYISLSFIDMQGAVVADTEGLVNRSITPTRWLQDIIITGKPTALTDIEFSTLLRRNVIYFIMPVENADRKLTGAVLARIAIEGIYYMLGEIQQDIKSVGIDLISKDGQILYSNRDRNAMFQNRTVKLKQLTTELEQQRFVTQAQEKGYLNFQGNQWTLLLHYPIKEAFAEVIQLRNYALMGGGLLVGITTLLIILFARRFTKPLTLLQEATLKLGQGDLTVQAPVFSKDEIGQLALTFNKTVQSLKEALEAKSVANGIIHEKETILRSVIDTMPDLVFWKDIHSVYLGCNKAVAEMNNLKSAREIVGKTDFDLQWCEQAEKYRNDDNRIMTTNQSELYFEEKTVDKNGNLAWAEASKVPLHDSHNRVIGILGIARDITERKRTEEALRISEERLDLAMRGSTDALWDWDMTTDKVYFSTNWGRMLGTMTYSDDLSEWSERLHPEDAVRVFLELSAYLERRVSALESLYRLRHEDGNYLWVLARGIAVWNEQGKAIRMTGTLVNMTPQKQLEESLQKAKDAAEVANQAKSTFLANMSHELRTPLNGILGYAQILSRDGTLTEKQKEGIKIIRRSGEYLLTLINDILDIAKVETGKIELYPMDINFQEFIENLVELFQIRAQQKNIAFNYEPLSYLPLGVRVDDKRLRQILVNLLGNAIKFTQKGGVTLKVGYNEGKFLFWIEDTGIGITSEDTERIFQPFQQIGNSLQKAEGTGLGLSITKRLVEMMGGKLHVSSQLGKGSLFWVELTLSDVSHLLKKENNKTLGIISGFKGERRKILVIDDKKENCSVMVSLLAPLGFELIEAANGFEGIQRAQAHHPDLILIDLVMPIMDGFEAVRRLRKIPDFKDTPIVASSASVFDLQQRDSITAGCNDFIPKPVNMDDLLLVLGKLLKLDWIYEEGLTKSAEKMEKPNSLDQSLVGPSPGKAAVLLDLALMGDIGGILKKLSLLEKEDSKLKPFVDQISKLAKNFEEEKICMLLESYVKQKKSH